MLLLPICRFLALTALDLAHQALALAIQTGLLEERQTNTTTKVVNRNDKPIQTATDTHHEQPTP